MCFRGSRIVVDIRPDSASYHLVAGDAVHTSHHGEHIVVGPGDPVTRAIPEIPQLERPAQPPGREPRRRAK
jgi:alpha,alpha-trehalose phosphorylase